MHVLQQDAGALPVGWRLEPGKLDRASDAQAKLHRGGDELALGIRGWNARDNFRIPDHEMITALGLEWDVVAQLGC